MFIGRGSLGLVVGGSAARRSIPMSQGGAVPQDHQDSPQSRIRGGGGGGGKEQAGCLKSPARGHSRPVLPDRATHVGWVAW